MRIALIPSCSYISFTCTPLFYRVKKKNISLLIFCLWSFSCFSFLFSLSLRRSLSSIKISLLSVIRWRESSTVLRLTSSSFRCYPEDDRRFVYLLVKFFAVFSFTATVAPLGELLSVRLYLTVLSSISQGESSLLTGTTSVSCRFIPRLWLQWLLGFYKLEDYRSVKPLISSLLF